MAQIDEFLMAYLVFGLTLIRCSGLTVFAPFYGAEHFPTTARIGMAVFFALLLYPSAQATAVIPPVLGGPELLFLALQEVSIGLVTGFLSSFVFMGAQLAGQLTGTQVGFALANVIDPMMDREISIIGFFKMNLAMVIFLILNLHLLVVEILQASYGYIGIGCLVFQDALGPLNEMAQLQAERIFVIGVQLSAPILLVMLLNSVIVGFITRTMPQMNIMVLGLPMRVLLGVFILMTVTPGLCMAMQDMLMVMVDDLNNTLKAISPKP